MSYKNLGIGVGLRPPHYSYFLEQKPKSVNWVEVISENFMGLREWPHSQAQQTLLRIRQNVNIALHGVSMSLGSAHPPSKEYLVRLKSLIKKINPIWVSDHLAWCQFQGQNFHDLLPIPYTEEALAIVTENIQRAQDFLGCQLLIENPSSYLQFSNSELSESEFLAELAQQADCAILLDVNNVYVSSVNHQFDPIAYIKNLPAQRIKQIHLAGHCPKESIIIDTHDAPVCPEVWMLYQATLKHLGPINTMIERDANIPSWAELEAELKIAQHFYEQASIEKHITTNNLLL